MGYMRHHAIVVTSWDEKLANKAHKKAVKLFPIVSEITKTAINGYRSFLVPPDGSKEGWEDSDRGDAARKKFNEYLESLRYEDGSTSIAWIEVQFADDNNETLIVSHS